MNVAGKCFFEIDKDRIDAIASYIKQHDFKMAESFDGFLPPGFSDTKIPAYLKINYFFLHSVLNFGFWIGDGRGYKEPLIFKTSDGKDFKGSSLWTAIIDRNFRECPDRFSVHSLEQLSYHDFCRHFGEFEFRPVNFPQMDERYRILNAMALWFPTNDLNPWKIVEKINFERGMDIFSRLVYEYLLLIPGFGEDPLLKKAWLLAMALVLGGFFGENKYPAGDWPPIVDYHLMRLALRQGMVVPAHYCGKEITDILVSRAWCGELIYNTIRERVWLAFTLLIDRVEDAGWHMFNIDSLYWQGRRYCPEMSVPDCKNCFFNPVCAQKTEMFQPVFRTTFC
jgi:hypothetical protein